MIVMEYSCKWVRWHTHLYEYSIIIIITEFLQQITPIKTNKMYLLMFTASLGISLDSQISVIAII